MTGPQPHKGTLDATEVAEGLPVGPEAREAAVAPFTLYPKHPTADDVYFIGGAWAPAAITAIDKRFTDAELMAEYWAAHGEANALMTSNPPLRFSRRAILRRFATLPHHDEEPT